MKRRDNLQGGDDAQNPVEAAAEWHGIKVRADKDGRGVLVLTGPTSVDVAKVVDAHRQVQLAQPVDEQITRGAIGV